MKSKRNEFWVVKMNPKYGNTYGMFNSMPRKLPIYMGYGEPMIEDWFATHSHCYLSDDATQKFSDVSFDTEPVKVRLIRSNSERPDFYVERCGDNLFIGVFTETYYQCERVKRNGLLGRIFKTKLDCGKRVRVPHVHRISNRLFKDIQEKDGIIKMDIERIEV